MPTFSRLKRNSWALVAAGLGLSSLPSCGGPELESLEEVNPSALQAAAMPACHTALASFDGTTAYSNGPYTGTGTSCGGVVASGYQYQCVELVMRHFMRKWGLRWYGNAKDLLRNAPRASVDVYSNGDRAHPPVPGDMVIWENSTYGHVALVVGVRPGAVDIIEQNVSGNGKATLSYDGSRIGARWSSWVPTGWAHAKANTGGGPGPSWDCSKSDYMGKQVWTCDGNARWKCDAGVPRSEACGLGCFPASVGQDDLCIASASGWSCASSSYMGKQYWTCNGGSLYRCDGSTPTMVRCGSGCSSRPLGTDDVCN